MTRYLCMVVFQLLISKVAAPGGSYWKPPALPEEPHWNFWVSWNNVPHIEGRYRAGYHHVRFIPLQLNKHL